MSDTNNNPGQGNAVNQAQQNSNSSMVGNSYGTTPGLNYGNGYSGYDRSSSFNSYMDDPYGRSNSSYSGYSGYGGGYGFNRSYSSGYGGYSSGYGGYSNQNSNQYSNQYSKPLPQNAQNEQQQVPPPNLRHDVWGFLNGFHAMLNVLYAATGIVHFGKMFLKMSMKIIKAICGKSLGLVFKLTGFKFLKNIMMRFSGSNNWSSEFNVPDQPFESAWGNGSVNANSTIFGKIMLVLRVCSLLGTMFALFLRSKVKSQHPPVQAEVVGPEDFPNEAVPKPAEFEKVKSFYDEIRLIEDDQQLSSQNNLPLIPNVSSQQQEDADTDAIFVQAYEDAKAAFESLAPESEPIKVVSEQNEENSAEALEVKELLEKAEPSKEIIEVAPVPEGINKEESVFSSALGRLESSISMVPSEIPKLEHASTMDTISTNMSSASKDPIVSEDFWKNQETYKAIENIQKEEKEKPEENKKKEFELPSVLKTLRSSSSMSSSSTKPWLMKKKKTVEVPVEVPQEVQSAQAETLEKITETPKEVNEEKMPEAQQVLGVPEVKLEGVVENVEGTTV